MKNEQEREGLLLTGTFFIIAGVLLALFLASGCAATNRSAGLGAVGNENGIGLRGHMMTTEDGKFGWFGAIQAGGQGPSADDEFGSDTGPFVPGPESTLSSRSETSALFAGAQGGATYRKGNVALLMGLSLNGEQTYDGYKYTTPFSGSGKYHTESDVHMRVGAYIGAEFFLPSEGGSIGVGYDTGLEAFNVSIGIDF